jgi:5'(3')-deoxyribonucleotidase
MSTTSPLTERDQRVSDHLVRLIQIVFGLVVAQSLVLSRGVLLNPLTEQNRVSALATFAVYVMTVLSWIDWHATVTNYPYNLSSYNKRRKAEYLKLWLDLLIVVAYAYLLFKAESLAGRSGHDLRGYIWGLPVVYSLYLAVGIARSRGARRRASYYMPILSFLVAFILLALVYRRFNSAFGVELDRATGNLVALLVVVVLTVLYRVARARFRASLSGKEKAQGLVVGIDVDGVLADQIRGILPRVKHRLGITLTREEVTDWALPIGESDIAKEILAAMESDEDYPRSMRPHEGASELVRTLARNNQIKIVTARPATVEGTTREWLDTNGLPYDDLINTKEGKKSLFGLDVLLDDYIGNLVPLLENSDAVAVLVDQPWNQKRDSLQQYIDEGRAFVISDLREAIEIVEYLRVLRQLERRQSGAASKGGKPPAYPSTGVSLLACVTFPHGISNM